MKTLLILSALIGSLFSQVSSNWAWFSSTSGWGWVYREGTGLVMYSNNSNDFKINLYDSDKFKRYEISGSMKSNKINAFVHTLNTDSVSWPVIGFYSVRVRTNNNETYTNESPIILNIKRSPTEVITLENILMYDTLGLVVFGLKKQSQCFVK